MPRVQGGASVLRAVLSELRDEALKKGKRKKFGKTNRFHFAFQLLPPRRVLTSS
jgi:hypothetical protein